MPRFLIRLLALLLFLPALAFAQNYGPSSGGALPPGASTSANQTAVQGAIGAGTAPANMNVTGCVYNSTLPTMTTGQSAATQCDPSGRTFTTTQPSTTNVVTGTASQATGSTTTALITAVASNRIYVTAFSCANTGSTTSLVSFQDGSGGTTLWTTIAPTVGGSNMDGNLPLFRTTSGNGLYFVPASSSTTVYCSASGFSGP
jgi:hypothetical protein